MLIFYLLVNYIFNPNLSNYEENYIIQKYNIPITIKKEKKVDFISLSKLYGNGLYQEYIKDFEKKYQYLKIESAKQFYVNYLLSLKILKAKNYKEQLCIIKSSLASFEKIPEFLIKDMPDKCDILKISISLNPNYNIFINGLPVLDSNFFVNEIPYKITIITERSKKVIFKTKIENKKRIDNEYLINYFNIYLKNGYFYSENIEKIPFKSKTHYFYKKDKLYHKIIDGNKVSLEIIKIKNMLKKTDFNKNNTQRPPFYKKWYFYATTIAIVLTVASISYFTKEKNNTRVIWLKP